MARSKYDAERENNLEIQAHVRTVAERHEASMADIALAWLLARGVTAPVVGCMRPERVSDAVRALEVELTEAEVAFLEEPYHAHDLVGPAGRPGEKAPAGTMKGLKTKRESRMAEKIVQKAGREQLGDFAPDFAHFNDDVLFGENWNNTDLDLRTRCIITVVALMAQGITDQALKYHLQNAKDHGVTRREIAAIVTHVAFYAGWPKAWAVFTLAKDIWTD